MPDTGTSTSAHPAPQKLPRHPAVAKPLKELMQIMRMSPSQGRVEALLGLYDKMTKPAKPSKIEQVAAMALLALPIAAAVTCVVGFFLMPLTMLPLKIGIDLVVASGMSWACAAAFIDSKENAEDKVAKLIAADAETVLASKPHIRNNLTFYNRHRLSVLFHEAGVAEEKHTSRKPLRPARPARTTKSLKQLQST